MTDEKGRSFWSELLYSAVTLATLVGTFLGAQAVDSLWVWWALWGLAFTYALCRWGLPKAARSIRHFQQLLANGRDYEKLKTAAGRLQDSLNTVQEQLRQQSTESMSAEERGISEGRRRLLGEYSAISSGPSLKPLSKAVDADGLLIAAEGAPDMPIMMESLWCLRVKGVGKVVAMLKVVDVPSDELVLLRVDHQKDEDYVSALVESCRASSDFPASLEIVSRTVASLEDLKEEV